MQSQVYLPLHKEFTAENKAALDVYVFAREDAIKYERNVHVSILESAIKHERHMSAPVPESTVKYEQKALQSCGTGSLCVCVWAGSDLWRSFSSRLFAVSCSCKRLCSSRLSSSRTLYVRRRSVWEWVRILAREKVVWKSFRNNALKLKRKISCFDSIMKGKSEIG